MADVSVTLQPPYLCPSEGHKNGISIQSSLNLGETLLQITCEWKTAKTWFLATLLMYQSSIVSQILDFIHWTVMIFSFDLMTGENQELAVRKVIECRNKSYTCGENTWTAGFFMLVFWVKVNNLAWLYKKTANYLLTSLNNSIFN